MIIKICGITTLEAAQVAQRAGADWLGFVFAPSRRKIEVSMAQSISKQLRAIQKVGVFVDAPLVEVLDVARTCQLDLIQLHGNESPEYCKSIPYPTIKGIRVDATTDFSTMVEYPATYILLDSLVAGQMGGTGTAFDWRAVAKACSPISKRLLVAGGLNAENVKEAIQILQPQGIDVSGGVESNGCKDHEKIARFIRVAREAEREQTIC